MKKLKSSNQGSSLVEIVLAVVILGIITVPLIRTFVVGAHTSRKSAELSDATVAAQSLVERISAVNMDVLLNTPEKVFKTAELYVENSENEPPELYDTRIYIPKISGGSRQFDALVTISANNEDNEKPIGIYSEIDAMISIVGYDSIAEMDYIAQCTPVVEEGEIVPKLSINMLSRSITISALQKDNGDYEVTVTALYKDSTYGFSRSYSESAFIKGVSSSDTEPGSETDPEPGSEPKSDEAVFSVFLIYDAYYKTGSYYTHDIIEIVKASIDMPDYNVFLVNTNAEKTIPGTYRLNIEYKKQKPNQTRVFTSFALNNEDAALGFFNNVPVSGYLVEEKAKDRRYTITVDLYRAGESPVDGFEGDPVFSLESKRLY